MRVSATECIWDPSPSRLIYLSWDHLKSTGHAAVFSILPEHHAKYGEAIMPPGEERLITGLWGIGSIPASNRRDMAGLEE